MLSLKNWVNQILCIENGDPHCYPIAYWIKALLFQVKSLKKQTAKNRTKVFFFSIGTELMEHKKPWGRARIEPAPSPS